MAMMAIVFFLLVSRIATRVATASLAPSHLLSTNRIPCTRHYVDVDGQISKQSFISSHILNDIRGGGTGEGGGDSETYNYGTQQQQLPQQMGGQQFQSTAAGPPPSGVSPAEYKIDANSMPTGAAPTNDPMYGYRETVEDRIDAWRKQQQQLQQTQSAEEAASAVDDQGRFKLFTSVSRMSVSIFFFILMWRTVHHYELADATFGSGRGKNGVGIGPMLVRTVVVTPLVVLFIGEMMGSVLGLAGGGGIGGVSNASHTTKKRLKGILNLHKFVELVMMFYNVIRLAIWPSKYVMREVYIGRTISNFFFLMQAQIYTKLTWDDVSKSTIGEGGYATESFYDDYTPDMAGNNYDDDYSSWQSPPSEGGEYYNSQGISPPHEQQQQYQQKYDDNSTGWS